MNRRAADRLRPGIVLLSGLALVAAGCSDADDVERDAARTLADGSAKATLQVYFDSHRQCASILSGTYPLGFSSRDPINGYPGERIFFEIGLLELTAAPVAKTGRDATLRDRVLAGYESYAVPTAEGHRWFKIDERDGARPLSLCYAKRQVTNVWIDGDRDEPRLRYTYRLADVAPWANRPEVRRAFPFLNAALGAELTGPEQLLPFRDGSWDLSYMNVEIRLPDGRYDYFAYCPPADEKDQPPGCEGRKP